jgi:hypothetical protein
MFLDCHKRLETALAHLEARLPQATWDRSGTHESNTGIPKCSSHHLEILWPCPSIATIVLLQADQKESNEQGAEIGESESTIMEVEVVVKPTEEWILNSQLLNY